MRVLASLLTAAVLVGALAGCAKNTSQETSTTTTAAPETATTAPANVAMAPQGALTKLPVYPGAKTEAAGSTSSVGMGGTASGSVMSTIDAFDKVYKWYQAHMPAGSERTHVTAAGTESAVFVIGPASTPPQSVTISRTAATGGKTMITLAQVTR